MIESLEVRNFQSLKSVDIALGSLTVIVGDSNVGKSGFIRSLKSLASNMRGTGSVTHGCKSASISAKTASSKVTLEKGEGHGAYRLSTAEAEKEYTKLGFEVPVDITKELGLDPVKDGVSISFAGQHDSPFLLTVSGAETARVLGDLTKVNTVLEAVREANRRRSSTSSELKLRSVDLEKANEELASRDILVKRKSSLQASKAVLDTARELESRRSRLLELTSILEDSEIPVLKEVPDISQLANVSSVFFKMRDRLSTYATACAKLGAANSKCLELEEKALALESELDVVLREAGSCPTCGSLIT